MFSILSKKFSCAYHVVDENVVDVEGLHWIHLGKGLAYLQLLPIMASILGLDGKLALRPSFVLYLVMALLIPLYDANSRVANYFPTNAHYWTNRSFLYDYVWYGLPQLWFFYSDTSLPLWTKLFN